MNGKNELYLFDDEEIRPKPKRPQRSGGSANPIVFKDYDSYVAKFTEKERTTDDTFTPKDVYEAVLQYVREVYDMTDKVVLRPFYPGGDFENAEYPENGVVVDNPPFSIFTKIVRFYSDRRIPFFLFGPGMTIGSCTRYCTAVILGGGGNYLREQGRGALQLRQQPLRRHRHHDRPEAHGAHQQM